MQVVTCGTGSRSGVVPYQPSWHGSVNWSSDESEEEGGELEPADSMDVYQPQEGGQVWRIIPRHIQICTHRDGTLHQLGDGGYATVYKGLLKSTPCAVKVLNNFDGKAPGSSSAL